jgi:hypothetical protein
MPHQLSPRAAGPFHVVAFYVIALRVYGAEPPENQREGEQARRRRRVRHHFDQAFLERAALGEPVWKFSHQFDRLDAHTPDRRDDVGGEYRQRGYTAHKNATLTARGPRLSFGHRSPKPRKMTACSALSVCTDNPMRGEAKYGMANPSSAENSRSATPN